MNWKKTFIVILISFIYNINYSQKYSCHEIMNYVKNNYDKQEIVICYGSKMLIKAEWYEIDGTGYVIAYFSQFDYDIYGKPYIFCGISRERWYSFKLNGTYGSWGESFHEKIMNLKCDCY